VNSGGPSIISRQGVSYPEPDDFFSPRTRFPEYQFEHVGTKPNVVYEMVREALTQAGLDAGNFGTPRWNPLREFIPPGSSVFVLCNFVYHRRPNETVASFHGKCVHASVLRAVLDYVLLAVGRGGRVAFGNAPLQACRWDKVLDDTGASAVLNFYKKVGWQTEARDLRLKVVDYSLLGRTVETQSRNEAKESVEVDLGTASLLSELTFANGSTSRFRVNDYDPRRTEAFQSAEHHRYVISRAIVEADAVVSLSKLKTHSKVGITCGLKGFVGVVGHKDCLAHYRLGSPATGGDEYPDGSHLSLALSKLNECTWGRDHGRIGRGALQILHRSACRVLARGKIMGGGWYGNDTAWRMALDLARIVRAVDKAGRMSESAQRTNISFIDGVVGGEGEGPLSPKPVNSGAIVFSPDVALGDRVACRLMGFDPEALPLIREVFRPMKYPVSELNPSECMVSFNGKRLSETQLGPILSRRFLPPRGWSDHLGAER
jgi:uncharacterized protein (DUF362 family)